MKLMDFTAKPSDVLQDYFLTNYTSSRHRQKVDGADTLTWPTFVRLLLGDEPITQDSAVELEKLFGRPAKFWLTLQSDYDKDQQENGAET